MWLYSSPPIAAGAVVSAAARAVWRRAELLVRQAQSPRNNLDVTCELGCSFSTGSCSDSVRELVGEPEQHPTNSPWLASRTAFRVVAAGGPLPCFLFAHVVRLVAAFRC